MSFFLLKILELRAGFNFTLHSFLLQGYLVPKLPIQEQFNNPGNMVHVKRSVLC